jgi:hypothetical protein
MYVLFLVKRRMGLRGIDFTLRRLCMRHIQTVENE